MRKEGLQRTIMRLFKVAIIALISTWTVVALPALKLSDKSSEKKLQKRGIPPELWGFLIGFVPLAARETYIAVRKAGTVPQLLAKCLEETSVWKHPVYDSEHLCVVLHF